MKWCPCCEEFKELECFNKLKTSKDGCSRICKLCRKIYRKGLRKKYKHLELFEQNLKRCSRCKEIKQLENFGKDRHRKDGYCSSCKGCREKYRNKDNKKLPKNNILYSVAGESCKKVCSKCKTLKDINLFSKDKYDNTGYHSQCKECRNAYKHSEHAKKLEKQYRKRNAAKLNQNSKRYRRKNVDKVREYNRKYVKLCKEKYPNRAVLYNLRINKDLYEIFEKDWKQRKEEYNYCCAYCGVSEAELMKLGKKLTIDHFIPIARGGDNNIENLIPACQSCNSSKGKKHPFDYMFDLDLFH